MNVYLVYSLEFDRDKPRGSNTEPSVSLVTSDINKALDVLKIKHEGLVERFKNEKGACFDFDFCKTNWIYDYEDEYLYGSIGIIKSVLEQSTYNNKDDEEEKIISNSIPKNSKEICSDIINIPTKGLCFTGHRPNRLGGYDWNNPKNKLIMTNLKKSVEHILINNNNYDIKKIYFGGALGVDQMAFDIVYSIKREHNLNVQLILAIPFEEQPKKWFKKEDIERYNKQKSLADSVVYVDTLDEYKHNFSIVGEYHAVKMTKRNKYMVDNSDVIIAVWDCTPEGGTFNCVSYAKSKNKECIIINPKIELLKEKVTSLNYDIKDLQTQMHNVEQGFK